MREVFQAVWAMLLLFAGIVCAFLCGMKLTALTSHHQHIIGWSLFGTVCVMLFWAVYRRG